MDSACVYKQKTVINELNERMQMAKQLRGNLNSPEARQFLIQKILSSYENALYVLKSGDSSGKHWATAVPEPSVPESPISTRSPQSRESTFDQFDQLSIYHQGKNVVSNKRKGSTVLEAAYNGKQTCNNGTQSAPPPPYSPENHEIKPTHQHNHYHDQLSPPDPREMIPKLKTNLTSNKWVFEDYQQLQFPDHFDNELLQVHSPPLISPTNSESNYFTEWNSLPSLDFCADPADVDPNFEFTNSFLMQ